MKKKTYILYLILFSLLFSTKTLLSQSCCTCRVPPYESEDTICFEFQNGNCDGGGCSNAQCIALTGNSLAISLNNNFCSTNTCPIVCPNTILPIELTSFDVSFVNINQIELAWKTASETNNYGFSVQRSSDGFVFKEIAFTLGEGTTLKETNYTFIDTSPKPNGNYYRLEQIDFDGQSSFSRVLFINHKVTSNQIQVFPNPTSDFLNIVADGSFDKIEIFDAFGNVASSTYYSSNIPSTFDTSNLPNGYYYISVSGADLPMITSFIKY